MLIIFNSLDNVFYAVNVFMLKIKGIEVSHYAITHYMDSSFWN